MTVSEVLAKVGGLSSPSKLPCFGFSLPAARCKVGGRLRLVVGSICSACYALKGRYVFPNVKNALERRYSILMAGLSSGEWVADMIAALALAKVRKTGFFRWHDAGDVQGLAHLRAIAAIAESSPWLRHWLPTREAGVVAKFLRDGGTFPENLTVRVSLPMVGMGEPSGTPYLTSGVAAVGTCPAPSQGGSCGDCRSCWDRDVPHVVYAKH